MKNLIKNYLMVFYLEEGVYDKHVSQDKEIHELWDAAWYITWFITLMAIICLFVLFLLFQSKVIFLWLISLCFINYKFIAWPCNWYQNYVSFVFETTKLTKNFFNNSEIKEDAKKIEKELNGKQNKHD